MGDNERPRVTRTNPLDEAAARLLDRLTHAASRGAGREEARAGCSFETFVKQNPPSFDGKPNPTKAENWFLQMEKLLEALDWVDNYAKLVKRVMRLEEDFKNNVRNENPPRNTGQTSFQQGNAQGHWSKKGSFGRSGSN
nr:hypothetical protein CFP56_63304 [Quercus suber]